MTESLANKRCVPCEGGTPPLKGFALVSLKDRLDEGWHVIDEHHLEREYRFKNFRQALDFTNVVGEIAEDQGHHPEICVGWGKVKVSIWTHEVDGLTENDFIFAAKVDAEKPSRPSDS